MNKEIFKTLNMKKQKKEFARITRKYGGKYTKNIERGIVHNISNSLVQICSIEDFKFEESSIFPTKHISKLRFNRNDKYYDHILQLEKIPNKLKTASNPNLTNWNSFFNSLKTDCLIIETENSKNRTFHIGSVIVVKKKKIKFLYFNAQGKVDKTPYSIKYNDITKVILDSNYSNVFKNHVRK